MQQSYEGVQSGSHSGFGSKENKRTAGQYAKKAPNVADDYMEAANDPIYHDDYAKAANDPIYHDYDFNCGIGLFNEVVNGTIIATFLTGIVNPPPGYDNEDLC